MAPSGSFPVHNLLRQRELEATAVAADVVGLEAGGAAGMNPAAPGAAGSRRTRFGVGEVAAAVPGEGREPTVGMVVAAGVAAARTFLGWKSEALRAAAAVVVVGLRSRRMLDRLEVEGMLSLGWSFGRYAMARSGAMIGGAAGAFESHAGADVLREAVAADIAVVGAEVDIAEKGFERRKHPALAGCIGTSCSYLGTARGMVLVRDVLVGTQGSRLETEEVVHSCRIVVRCRSSSFPCRRHGGSSERH